jgi:hypothetical protein
MQNGLRMKLCMRDRAARAAGLGDQIFSKPPALTPISMRHHGHGTLAVGPGQVWRRYRRGAPHHELPARPPDLFLRWAGGGPSARRHGRVPRLPFLPSPARGSLPVSGVVRVPQLGVRDKWNSLPFPSRAGVVR